MTVKTEEKLPEKEIVKQDPPKSDAPIEAKKEEKSPEETPEQINWKKFREVREQERKQREAAEKTAREETEKAKALKAALDAVLSKPAPNPVNEYGDEPEEDIIEKKVQEALKKERNRINQEQQEREAKELPTKLATTYTDFNRVVTEENLDYLEYHYPGVAQAFKKQPDSYDKWASIYSTIKQLIPNSDNKKDQQKMEKNMAKPVSQSVGGIATSGDHAPHILSDQKRKDNWARMNRVIKGLQ